MIEIITGLPGFGKTLTASRWALKKMKKGKKVYANYPLQGAEYFADILQVLGKVENALIVVDEAGIVFDQLTMYSMPQQTWMELRQHRKDGVDLLLTAQSMHDVAYPLRRLIQFEYNIFFKFDRFVTVTCRNPQRGGDNYGKRLWYLSPSLFGKYDTKHKVALENAQETQEEAPMTSDRFEWYRNIQESMLLEAADGLAASLVKR